MHTRLPLALSAVCLALLVHQPARAGVGAEPAPITSVEVFANSAMLIVPPREPRFAYSVYRIDGISMVEQMLAQDMPTTEAEAKAYFNQNYPALMKRFKPLIRNAADGLNLAMQYQIDHLPAVVINQRSVVFGVASVDQAIAEYLDHEATKAKRNLTFLPSVPPVPWK